MCSIKYLVQVVIFICCIESAQTQSSRSAWTGETFEARTEENPRSWDGNSQSNEECHTVFRQRHTVDKLYIKDVFNFLNRKSAWRVLLGLPRDVGSNNRIAVTYLIAVVLHICDGNNCVEKKHCAQEKAATAIPSPVKIYLRQDARRFAYINESREEIM